MAAGQVARLLERLDAVERECDRLHKEIEVARAALLRLWGHWSTKKEIGDGIQVHCIASDEVVWTEQQINEALDAIGGQPR